MKKDKTTEGDTMKVLKDDVGKVVLVRFDDIGRMEGILVEKEEMRAKVFFPSDNTLENLELSQIIEVGKRIRIPA